MDVIILRPASVDEQLFEEILSLDRREIASNPRRHAKDGPSTNTSAKSHSTSSGGPSCKYTYKVEAAQLLTPCCAATLQSSLHTEATGSRRRSSRLALVRDRSEDGRVDIDDGGS
jgi:hypothetical protein